MTTAWEVGPALLLHEDFDICQRIGSLSPRPSVCMMTVDSLIMLCCFRFCGKVTSPHPSHQQKRLIDASSRSWEAFYVTLQYDGVRALKAV